jgi:hypothetical protein
MASKNDKTASAEKKTTTDTQPMFAFGKDNYRLLLIGLGVIVLGFILMIGGGSDDPNKFNDAIFNFQRLTLAPILILGGYVIEIFAIMKKPKQQ